MLDPGTLLYLITSLPNPDVPIVIAAARSADDATFKAIEVIISAVNAILAAAVFFLGYQANKLSRRVLLSGALNEAAKLAEDPKLDANDTKKRIEAMGQVLFPSEPDARKSLLDYADALGRN